MCDVNIDGIPLVIVTFDSVYKNENDVCNVINDLEKIYTIEDKFCLLMDISKVEYINPNVIAKLVKWFLKKKKLSEKYLICTCLLITNPIIHTLIQASLKFVKLARPYFVMKNRSEWYLYAMITFIFALKGENVIPVAVPALPPTFP